MHGKPIKVSKKILNIVLLTFFYDRRPAAFYMEIQAA